MKKLKLAERLGYGCYDRLLIVNCDDFGSSHSANIATVRGMSQGIATSASLMVPCPWAREAAHMSEGLPLGIHLTLTSEHKGYRWRPLTGGASLRDHDGFFPSTARKVLEQATAAYIIAECTAQVKAALAWGVDVSHLDVHMDVLFKSIDLFDIYLSLASDFDLPVRLPSESTIESQGIPFRTQAHSRGILSSEHLIYAWPRLTRDVLFEVIPGLPTGVSEIFVHPVLDSLELQGYDDANADIRMHDAECLIDSGIMNLLKSHGIKLVNYRRIRDIQRKIL